MKHLNKCRLVGGILLVLGALILSWLLSSESSPLYKYFLYHVALPNAWAAINAIPYIFAILSSSMFKSIGLPEIGGYIGLFVQWFFIGWLLSAPICKRVKARNRKRLATQKPQDVPPPST